VIEWCDAWPHVSVDPAAYYRLLGYPPGVTPDGRASELAGMATEWFAAHGRAWVYVREVASLAVEGTAVVLDGATFTAKRLAKMLRADALGAVLVAASAGPQLEHEAAARWKDEKPDEYFFLEALGSAVVERLLVDTGARLCAWAEPRHAAVLPHDSPGYAGWNVAELCGLLALVGRTTTVEWPGPLEALDSGALRPKKSALAVFGLVRQSGEAAGRATSVPCHNCPAASCQYRRAPYRLASAQRAARGGAPRD
jgi:hypothetical protein